MGERWVSHLERARVAAGVERLLRQRFPTGAPGVALVRLPIPTAGLRRIAEDVAAVVCGPVDPDAAAVNLDVEVLVLVLQELVALVVDRIAADEATAAVLEAALDAGELLADLGRPVTSDVVAGCTR